MGFDPETVSRQGRQVREEASAGPQAAWRPLRALREKFSENGRFGGRTCHAKGVKRRFQAVFDHFSPARPVAARFR